MRKIPVLLVSLKDNPPIWTETVCAVFGDRHDLRFFDKSMPIAPQFRGIEMVVDVGGWGTEDMVDAAVGCRLWQVLGTGLDHTPVDHMTSRGIRVANCPGELCGPSLAELAILFMLMLARDYAGAREELRKGALWAPIGRSLWDMTLGIVGFGASGRDLCRIAKAFGMRVEVIDVMDIPRVVVEEVRPDFVGTPSDLDALIPRCDVLSLHAPLNDETHHMIDARRLALMKPTAFLINVARGALVDEKALNEALLAGRIGGAGLDVFADEPIDPTLPVYRLPNVVVTPHVAGCTDLTVKRRAALALENADRLAEGLEPLHLV